MNKDIIIVIKLGKVTLFNHNLWKINIDSVAILVNEFGQHARHDMVEDDDGIIFLSRGGEIAGHMISNQLLLPDGPIELIASASVDSTSSGNQETSSDTTLQVSQPMPVHPPKDITRTQKATEGVSKSNCDPVTHYNCSPYLLQVLQTP